MIYEISKEKLKEIFNDIDKIHKALIFGAKYICDETLTYNMTIKNFNNYIHFKRNNIGDDFKIYLELN